MGVCQNANVFFRLSKDFNKKKNQNIKHSERMQMVITVVFFLLKSFTQIENITIAFDISCFQYKYYL